ncbi:hypothetical protein AOLI_G00153390 [Acnodon oligacanthus]
MSEISLFGASQQEEKRKFNQDVVSERDKISVSVASRTLRVDTAETERDRERERQRDRQREVFSRVLPVKMWLCVFLLYSGLQESSGCTVARGVGTTITKSVGDSVVLPCSCTNLQDVPRTVKWGFTTFSQFKFVVGDYTADHSVFPEDRSQDQRYRNRVQRLNHSKPGDLSLIISHLTEHDEGAYLCGVNGKYFSIIFVYVRGCAVLSFSERSFSRSPGESVLLPCPCPKEQQNIDPGRVTWSFSKTGTEDQTAVSNDAASYRGRVWMFDQSQSRNFSLLISDLTEDDSGEYNCMADDHTPYVMLHVKGCTLSETQEKLIIRSPGESVLLPCSCTDQHTKPVKDQGTYRCSINNKQSLNISLIIVTQHENSTDLFSVIVITLCVCVALLLFVVVGESALIHKLIHNKTQGSASTNTERGTQNTADKDYKDDPPENWMMVIMKMVFQETNKRPISQCLDPETDPSDSVYQNMAYQNTNQSD